MSLILFEKLEKPVIEFSNSLQNKILSEGRMGEDELTQYVRDSKLFNEISKETSTQIESAIDEFEGQQKDEKTSKCSKKLITKRKASISEKGILDIPNKRQKTVDLYSLRKYSRYLDIPITYPTNINSIDDCFDKDVLNHETDSEFWDKFKPQLHQSSSSSSDSLESDEELNKSNKKYTELIDCSLGECRRYLKNNCTNLVEVYVMIKEIYELDIVKYNYQLKYYIEILEFVIQLEGNNIDFV